MIQIAILGFGVVGSGTAAVLEENKQLLTARCGEEVNIKYILDLREFPEHPLGDRVVHSIDVILQDPEVVLVAEMMGGAHPAYDFTLAALQAGKSVVTSNKEVVATFGAELLEVARKHKVSYLFEASVGGGIPIIRPMQTDLASNEILSVSGILNGTTNFILTKMIREGASFDDVLKEAQRNGYAEADPTADVEGLDAARKIVILAALAFGVLLDPNAISTRGITGITSDHVAMAKALGGAVKLIGHTQQIEGKTLALVTPFLVPAANPVCHVDGVFNGILVEANMLGRALFYGAGAGKLPTASAVVADIIDVLSHRTQERKLPVWRVAEAEDYAPAEAFVCRHAYLMEGCSHCAAKAKAALQTEECVMLEGGRFAVVSAPMRRADADAALSSTGLEALVVLPVLD
ncbi:MAG: homoserine dehydrogenase [Clostridia bacterium]|nr:homoserine dehydrogenase [Clostridia bacterium]